LGIESAPAPATASRTSRKRIGTIKRDPATNVEIQMKKAYSLAMIGRQWADKAARKAADHAAQEAGKRSAEKAGYAGPMPTPTYTEPKPKRK
jgi:hypothetical protein